MRIMNKEFKISVLSYNESCAYWLSAVFVVGNVVLPQLCHLVPGGGLMWLPIYFFTLIAAYRYGLLTGLLTAVLSPIVNNLMFGMPPTPMLPIILVKSILLAFAAAFMAKRMKGAIFMGVALAVVTYQSLGSAVEWMMTGSLTAALQDVLIGYPGMVLQVFGGSSMLIMMRKAAGSHRP